MSRLVAGLCLVLAGASLGYAAATEQRRRVDAAQAEEEIARVVRMATACADQQALVMQDLARCSAR